MKTVRRFVKSLSNVHRPRGEKDVFLLSAPRSGSTWLMEMIATQPGFKWASEPFDIRYPHIREVLERFGIEKWEDYHDERSLPLFKRFLDAYLSGKIGMVTPGLHKYHYRWITRRIVVKILHACEDRLEWMDANFNAAIIFLIRHPIPVSISRKQHPRLDVFLNSPYMDLFPEEQKTYARKLRSTGDHFELNMLDWCFQNAVPLRSMKPDWTLVTYEQLVTDPAPALRSIAAKHGLPEPERMLARLDTPSRTTHMSDAKTKNMLASDATDKKTWLVQKWRKQVDEELEKRLMEIPRQLGIHLYKAGDFMPDKTAWIS